MSSKKEVSCIGLLALKRYLLKYHGQQGFEKVSKALFDSGKYFVFDKNNPAGIVPLKEHHIDDPSCWVSYDFALAFYENAREFLNEPDALYKAGEVSVEEYFSKSVYFISRILGIKFITKQTSRLNAKGNRVKEVTLLELNRNMAKLQVSYFPGYKASKDICDWNRGIYTGLGKMAGAIGVKCEEIQCAAEGAEKCIFAVSWKKGPNLFKRIVRRFLRSLTQDLIAEYETAVEESELLIDRLRQSEEKYRKVVESINVGMSIIKNGKITFVNSAISRFLKYSKEEILSNPEPSRYIHPNDWAMVKGNDTKKLTGQTGPRTYPFRILAKDGEAKWVEVTATKIHVDGKPATLNFYVNIAERKAAEDERARLEAQLQRSKKMEAVGTLAGGVAHDLNNILSGIVSYPDMLLMQLDEDSPLRNPILTMKDSGQKAAAIVNDLLTLARRGVLTEEIVNLNDVISEYLSSPEFEKLKSFHPNVKIETNLDPKLLNISGSPVHLSKTVMNLVSNAAEAIEDKGTISISSANEYIDKPFDGYENVFEGEYVVLKVVDTGIGIEPEEIEKIFEPFYTKKVMGRSGTGLGMAVVWGTVKDHEGIIDVNSTPGEGTTFTVYFPASRMKVIEEKELLSMQEYMGRGERILVVDDVKEQREIASSMLNALNYVVETVPSGEKAVDYVKGTRVDLLLLDMIMDPGIDGLDTYKKCLKFNPSQKAIITSGFSETIRVKEAQKLGAGPYVKKPYTLETIGVAVKNELDN